MFQRCIQKSSLYTSAILAIKRSSHGGLLAIVYTEMACLRLIFFLHLLLRGGRLRFLFILPNTIRNPSFLQQPGFSLSFLIYDTALLCCIAPQEPSVPL